MDVTTLLNSLINELQQESNATRSLLQAIPEEHFGWKPHDKSLSAGELAKHIAGIPGALFGVVNEDEFAIENALPDFASFTTSKELLELFESSLATALTGLQQIAPERAAGMWRMTRGGQTLLELPRIAGFRTLMFNHLYHHRGQLSVYLRLLNVPVPSTYGPTADVNVFE